MRLFTPGIFQEAFRLNAPTPRQLLAVRAVWLFGAVAAMVWMTALNDAPEHGAIAVTAIAAAPSQGSVVADADKP